MAECVRESDHCQYYYGDMASITLPDARLALPLRRHWWTLKRYVWYFSVLGLREFVRKIARPSMFQFAGLGRLTLVPNQKTSSAGEKGEVQNLLVGEWVEVRSAKEILATLDRQGKLKGLRFTPEMVKFCGKRLRVYRKLDKIILEATGELRKIRTPTVLLEGVFCDGSAHGGCDRSCFCFWREAWLKRVPSEASLKVDFR